MHQIISITQKRISNVDDQLCTIQTLLEPLAAHRLREVSREILLRALGCHGFSETSTKLLCPPWSILTRRHIPFAGARNKMMGHGTYSSIRVTSSELLYPDS